jgi:LDH2 family malate/lactate/ureidoglycolate dehydrogenase
MHRFPAAYLYSLTRRLFEAAGTPHHIAEEVSAHLVGANLAGHDSHGMLRIPAYLPSIERGGLNPAAEPEVLKETAGTLHIDGRNGFGQYSARKAMDRAIEKARQSDVCFVSMVRNGHIGRVGEYAEVAARAGCIGIISTGGGNRDGGSVVPFGGSKGRMGTNPIAIGVPTGDETPFVIDFATSVVAEGKIQVARSKGADLPPGCILDRDGNPSVKPADFYDGGAILTFGAHKGYALSLLTCLLGGLAGTFDPACGSMSGTCIQVLNVGALTSLKEYQQGVRAFLDGIKATPPAPGFKEVLAPGDFEARTRAERLAQGIDIPDTIYGQLEEWAKKLGVSLSEEAVEDADKARYR